MSQENFYFVSVIWIELCVSKISSYVKAFFSEQINSSRSACSSEKKKSLCPGNNYLVFIYSFCHILKMYSTMTL